MQSQTPRIRLRPLIRSGLYALAGAGLILWAPAPEGAGLAETPARAFGLGAGIAVCALALIALAASAANPRGRRDPAASAFRGPHRTDFTPLALLGRHPFDPVVCALLVAAAIALTPRAAVGTPTVLAVIGLVYGYNAWRRRSPRAWLQLTVSVAVPLALTALFLAGAEHYRFAVLASLPPATALGESLGALAERASGRRRPKLLRAAWHGIGSVRGRGDAGGPEASGAAAVAFDIRPLLQPVGRDEVRRFAARLPPDPLRRQALVLKPLFLAGAPLIAILLPTAFTDEKYVTGPDAAGQITGMAAFFALLILGYGIIGVVGSRAWRLSTTPADHLRLARFAAANGFAYSPGPEAGRGSGMLTRVLRGSRWTLANEARVTEQPSDSVAPVTQFSGFCEFRLPVALPHLLLVRRGLRAPAFSAFRAPARSQRLGLEGDFNRFFDVYCPNGYERDALYLLTPDVMAALVDGARGFDVEIIDDRLILRSRADLVTTDPGVWLTVAGAVGALSGRTRQWRLWRDDRGDGADGTAPRLLAERPTGAELAGRRLRGGASLGLGLAIGFGVLYAALTWLANAL